MPLDMPAQSLSAQAAASGHTGMAGLKGGRVWRQPPGTLFAQFAWFAVASGDLLSPPAAVNCAIPGQPPYSAP